MWWNIFLCQPNNIHWHTSKLFILLRILGFRKYKWILLQMAKTINFLEVFVLRNFGVFSFPYQHWIYMTIDLRTVSIFIYWHLFLQRGPLGIPVPTAVCTRRSFRCSSVTATMWLDRSIWKTVMSTIPRTTPARVSGHLTLISHSLSVLRNWQ